MTGSSPAMTIIGLSSHSAGSSDGVASRFAFVTAEIVEDDDIALFQGRHERLLYTIGEDVAIDRSVEDQRRNDMVVAQSGQEGQRLPMAMRHLVDQRLASRAPAVGAGHVGFDPGLVDEDQAGRIKPMLVASPSGAEPGDPVPILLARHQRFF